MRAPQRQHEAWLVRQDDGQVWAADAVLQAHLDRSWAVTRHPVEKGAQISDHVQPEAGVVTLSVVLTENPSAPGVQGGPEHLRSALQWLTDTADAGRLVDVVTRRLGILQSYQITAVPTTLDNVARLRFDLQLQQVRLASATLVQISVDTTSGTTAVGAPDEIDVGEQATTTDTDASAAEADQSVLAGLIDWV